MSPAHSILVGQVLYDAAESLMQGGFHDSRLEAGILLAHVMGISRTDLFFHLDDDILPEQGAELNRLIDRRLNHEPVAYLIGRKEFFGIDFQVTPDTLIPRPETELLVEKTIEVAGDRAVSIVDVGTGCGAVAVALAVYLPKSSIYATDVSSAALKIARANAQTHGTSSRICFIGGDLLQPLNSRVDIIVANLPYVSDREMGELSKGVGKYEPELALAGGVEGLDKIERLLSQAGEKLCSEGVILLEIGYEQGVSVVELVTQHVPKAEIYLFPDLSENDRLVLIKTGAIASK